MLKATPVITWPTPAAITYGTALSATQLNATSPASRARSSIRQRAARCSAAGAGQTLSVTFTPTDTANYTAATATVDDHRAEGDAGDHLADAGGDHLRHRAQRDAAERDRPGGRRGHVRLYAGERHGAAAGAGQTLSVTFTPTNTADYTAATATVAITVLKATPAITWPTPAAITYGTALSATQLNATAPAGVAGTFVYTPASGIVLGAGVGQTLSVTFTPTNTADYTAATATVAITVLKATPAITWPTPAPITYGTALSATQLNATGRGVPARSSTHRRSARC